MRHLLKQIWNTQGLARWIFWVGVAITLVFVVCAAFAPWVAPYDFAQTTVDGVKNNDELGNARLGATFALPLDRHHSIKFHASKGVAVRFGEDFTTFGLAWQYRWGAGL